MFYMGSAGIALMPGTYNFKMAVSDSSKKATGNFSLVIASGNYLAQADFQKSLAADINLPDAITGMGYGASLWTLGDGNLPWTWRIMSGELPPGLGLNENSGVIYGTPLLAAAGKSYEFRISVKDGIGADAIGEPTYHISIPR
jgi:hypothetical protein